jgi:hypothetical protein
MKFFSGDVVRHRHAPSDSIQNVVQSVDAGMARVIWLSPPKEPGGDEKMVIETIPVEDLVLYEAIMQFFRWQHLPERLQAFSRPFEELANRLILATGRNPERTIALRKLLEAKDAAVRAAMYQ